MKRRLTPDELLFKAGQLGVFELRDAVSKAIGRLKNRLIEGSIVEQIEFLLTQDDLPAVEQEILKAGQKVPKRGFDTDAWDWCPKCKSDLSYAKPHPNGTCSWCGCDIELASKQEIV